MNTRNPAERNSLSGPEPRAALFFLVTALFWFSNYAYIPTMSPYLKSIGVSYSLIGLIGGAYGLAQLIFRVPLGILSDRMGKRKVFIILGVFLGMVSSLLLFFVTHPALLWLARFASGMSASAWVIYTVLFSSYFDGSKMASRIAILNMANTLGVMVAKMSGSFLADASGYRAAFLLSGAVGLVGLILSFFVKENVPVAKSRPTVRQLVGVVKNKSLLTMSVLAIFSQMLFFATVNTFSPEKASMLGADSVQLGILATLSSIPVIFGAMICGWLFTRKVNFRALVALAFLLEGIGTLMTAYAPNVPFVHAAGVVGGFGFGICLTSLLSHCTLTVDADKRSVAMGFFQAIYGIGMFSGPVVTGAIADLLDVSTAIAISSLFAVAGLVLSLVLLREERSN